MKNFTSILNSVTIRAEVKKNGKLDQYTTHADEERIFKKQKVRRSRLCC